MLFYGPSGGGKKTRIACVLRELFGEGVEKACSMYSLENNTRRAHVVDVTFS